MGAGDETWTVDLERWLAPYLERLGHEAQRHWAPLYVAGLLLPGERKSLEPLAGRVAPTRAWSCGGASRPSPARASNRRT
ncbi:MAG TPA: transposase [Arenibaculum sp.]|jgi:SRSO17 transposase|nr:transposase [Arenibaculum sp.]